jgi:RNA polymerase sigma-70 factor (ECF subfamily)
VPGFGDDSDEALMLRYRDGDVRAFEQLVTRHRKPIYNFVLRFVRDSAQAEDLTQETFLRLVKGADAYERQAKFTTWLFTIARNLCVDASRRGKLRRAQSLDAPGDGDEGGPSLVERTAADAVAGTERQAQSRELAERLRRAIEALPEEQREIFLLREVADLQFNEISNVVGVPENTVKSRMRYALEKLREALEEYRDLARAVQ